MSDAASRTADGWIASDPASPPQVETVADRLQKLEAALNAMQNTSGMEQQLAERVITRVREQMPNGLASGDMLGVPGLVSLAAGAYPAVPGTDSGVWGPFAILRELRLMVKMYVDPRYRLSRVTQLVAPIAVILMVLNYFVFSFWSVPILAPIFERVILIVLAVVLYKVLSWEAHRYDAVLRYLATYGR